MGGGFWVDRIVKYKSGRPRREGVLTRLDTEVICAASPEHCCVVYMTTSEPEWNAGD